MRGRDTYYLFRIPILIMTLTVRVLPRRIRMFLWWSCESWKGNIGLLLRYTIAKSLSVGCGDVVSIGPYVDIRHWNNLALGSNVSIHRSCYLDASGGIKIGSDVSIAHSTSILSSNHQWGDLTVPIRDNPVTKEPVVIEDDVWIGCGCRIMPGVRIGRRSVIAAGAVVTRDVASGTVVGGIPARVLKNIELPDNTKAVQQ